MTSARTVTSGEISDAAMRAYRAAKALHRDGGNPAGAFELLASIVEDRLWEQLVNNSDRPFESFTAFVEAPEPGGLGVTTGELRKLLDLRHPHEDTRPWLERAPWLRGEVRRLLAEEVRPSADQGRPGKGGATAFSLHDQRGTADALTARLKRDDPDLAARVVAGEVTPNAAAREKGWRKPRVVLTSPSSVAARIRQHFTAEETAELIRLLLSDPD